MFQLLTAELERLFALTHALTSFGFTFGGATVLVLVVELLVDAPEVVEVVDELVVEDELGALEVAAVELVEVAAGVVELLSDALSDEPEQPVNATAPAATRAAAAPRRGVRADFIISPP